jgi:hypothetical protein
MTIRFFNGNIPENGKSKKALRDPETVSIYWVKDQPLMKPVEIGVHPWLFPLQSIDSVY